MGVGAVGWRVVVAEMGWWGWWWRWGWMVGVGVSEVGGIVG